MSESEDNVSATNSNGSKLPQTENNGTSLTQSASDSANSAGISQEQNDREKESTPSRPNVDKRKRTESEQETTSVSANLNVPVSPSHSASAACSSSFMTSASPPRFVGLEELMKTAVGLDNMAIAHEIAINPDFKLTSEGPAEGSLDQRVKEQMHRAFWDKLKEELDAQPPQFVMALDLLGEIKESLCSLLLPQHTRLRQEIDNHLNIDDLKHQVQVNGLQMDFKPTAGFIVHVMARLCSPARDKQIEELKQQQELIDLYKGIFTLLDLMKLDMANFTISSLRPTIQENSISYEREKFDEFLRTNPDGLCHTTVWLNRAFELWSSRQNLSQNSAKRQNVDQSPTKEAAPSLGLSANNETDLNLSPLQLSEIICEAFMMLLKWNDEWIFPETLMVDKSRLEELQSLNLQLTVCTSLNLVCMSAAGKNVADLSEFKQKLKDHSMTVLTGCAQKTLASVLAGLAIYSVQCINQYKLQLGENALSTEVADATKLQIQALASDDQSVRKLIESRIAGFVLGVVASPSAQPVRIPPGMTIVQRELAKLTGSFLRIVSHNRQVFGDQYKELVLRAYRRTQQPTASKV